MIPTHQNELCDNEMCKMKRTHTLCKRLIMNPTNIINAKVSACVYWMDLCVNICMRVTTDNVEVTEN